MIEILPDAAESIDAIGAWLLEQGGATVARRWLSRVESTLVFLERWPRTGGAFDTIDMRFEGVRLWPTKGFPHYLVFYREVPDGIEIIDVVHAARDLPRALGDD